MFIAVISGTIYSPTKISYNRLTYIFQLRDLIRYLLNFVIKRFGAFRFTFSHPALFRQTWGYAHKPVGPFVCPWQWTWHVRACLFKPLLFLPRSQGDLGAVDTMFTRRHCVQAMAWLLRSSNHMVSAEVHNLAWKLALRDIQTCCKSDTKATVVVVGH